jgi:hypothetical protein
MCKELGSGRGLSAGAATAVSPAVIAVEVRETQQKNYKKQLSMKRFLILQGTSNAEIHDCCRTRRIFPPDGNWCLQQKKGINGKKRMNTAFSGLKRWRR